jgi:DNA replication and repair protein RecF
MATKKEVFECEYRTQADGDTYDELKNSYFETYSSKKESEKERGFTLYGAHKDDFIININTKDARSYGSQGQQRSSVLALKLAEGEMSRSITGEYPVFLLDDVLSELDDSRKEFILAKLKGKQVIITDCSKNTSKYNCNNMIYVENGKYQKIKN